jgi:hypothetical protein
MKKNLKTAQLKVLIQSNRLEIIGDEEAKTIYGSGDPTPAQVAALMASLSGIFTQGTLITPQQWQEFNAKLTQLAETNVGYALLTALVNDANGRQIPITGIDPFGSSGGDGAQYNNGNANTGGSIDLGALVFNPNRMPTDWDYTKQDAKHFETIIHEIFHAFIFITTGDPQSYRDSVRAELDAFIFSTVNSG